MSRPIKITIPKPCHENWDAMTPVQKGRHCAACQKTVIDFTNMSDGDILRHLKKTSPLATDPRRPGPELCGRFMSDQLNRQLMPPPVLSGIRFKGWQWVFTGLLLTTDDQPTQRPRPPLQEHRIPVNTPQTNEKTLVGFALPSIIRDDTTVVKTKDTIVDVLGTPSVLVGDVKIEPFNIVGDPPDSLLRPICPPRADPADSAGEEVFVGGISLITADIFNTDDFEVAPIGNRDDYDTVIAKLPSSTVGGPTPSAENTLRIYPNPIPRGSAYHLQWPDNPGHYQVTLINTSGNLLQQTIIDITTPHQTTELQLPTGLAAGTYILRATRSGQSQSFTVKILVN